ncbi:MAG TPA: tetratricopeptide repeat protein [Anaerolineales bacterium]|jgi:tetratricopeptide (TPR) repeat protein
MMKVALRAYSREIEALIDQGHTDEALAHCMHILKSFPKHLETYRLMGKAYLEAHRYPEAADIFQRVLLAVPDDFVSHLGMSIVSDEQRELPSAIWHMERAFEVNSTNGGIQSELRRLYGRRDGVEPARIHLTRGALAHIYFKGGDFQQAITEIKSVLAEDPARTDMKTLLARTYYRAGMKNEALETCVELLKLYPYSVDANRILVEILPGSSMAQGLEQYQRRIRSLDPYAAHAAGSVFDTQAVPDDAVMVDRLDWDPGQRSQPAVYTPAAPASPEPASEIPEWMRQSGWEPSTGAAEPESFQPDETNLASAGAENLATADIPDWMKALAPIEPAPEPGPTAAASGQEAPEEVDFEWLAGLGAAGMAAAATTPAESTPAEPAPAEAATSAPEAEGDENLEWLSNLIPAQEEAPAVPEEASPDLPDWLKEAGATGTGAAEPGDELPDWLSNLGEPEQPQKATEDLAADTPENLPAGSMDIENNMDWLKSLEAEPLTPEPAATPAETPPDWLAGLGSGLPVDETGHISDVPAAAAPGWLDDLLASPTEEPPASPEAAGSAEAVPESSVAQPAAPAEMPLFSEGYQDMPPAASLLEAGAVQEPQGSSDEEAFHWLQDLVSGQGSQPEEPAQQTTTPEQTVAGVSAGQDEAIDWLSSLTQDQDVTAENPSGPAAVNAQPGEAAPESLPAAELPAGPALEPPTAEQTPLADEALSALVSGPGTSAAEQDDALAWLESLAQKQGANPEELITPPAGRSETAPAWVTGETPAEELPAVEAQPAAEQPSEPVAEMPATEEPPAAEQTPLADETLSALVSGPGTSAAEQDDALAWLESLALNQGAKPEELITPPAERSETAPAWVTGETAAVEQPVEELPAVEAQPAAEQPSEPLAEMPASEEPPAAEESLAAGMALSELVSGPGTSAAEQDDALAWLESLALNQGAKPEELITPPAERSETAPAWVTGETAAVEQPVEELPDVEAQPAAEQPSEPLAEMPASEEPPAAEEPLAAGMALAELGQETEDTAAEQEDTLSWLVSLNKAEMTKSQEPAGEAGIEPASAEMEKLAETTPRKVSQPPIEAAMPEPELTELGTASAGFAEELAAGEDFDWLGDLSRPEQASAEMAAGQTGMPQPAAQPLPDVPDVSSGWFDFSLRGKEEEPAAPAQAELPASMATSAETTGQPEETPAANEAIPAWYQSLEQPDEAQPPAIPMPWEQEAQATEPAEETPASFGEGQPPAPFEAPASGTVAAGEVEPGQTAEPVFPARAEQDAAWLASLGVAGPASAQPATPDETVEDAAWLASLDEDAEPVSVEPLPWEPASLPEEKMPWELESETEAAPAQPQATGDISAWLKSLGEQGEEPEELEEAEATGQVSSWLSPISAPVEPESAPEELPDWLRDPSLDEKKVEPPAAEIPQPAASAQVEAEPPQMEEPFQQAQEQPQVPELEPERLPAASLELEQITSAPEQTEQLPAASVEPEQTPATPVAPEPLMPARPVRASLAPSQPAQPGGDKDALALQNARGLLTQGSLDGAMSEYSRLIKRGKLLDEVIHDLKDAVYAHPVDVIIWQTLGDAYFRTNRLQEALDAYGKAEGLLR